MYLHPMAYLLGLEGVALLRSFSGDYDREFVQARLTEIRKLLDSLEQLGDGVTIAPISTADGYNSWAEYYDEPGNALLDWEGPMIRKILDDLPIGVALDAACGTGRHTGYLVSLGHRVIGVDSSPGMLAVAEAEVPGTEFHQADLTRLALPENHVDLVVCTLALSHLSDLTPVLAQFARVLRPGGHLVISDTRGVIGDIALPMIQYGPDGTPGAMPNHVHSTSDYLAAALPFGFQVRRCEEPRRRFPFVRQDGAPPLAYGPAPEYVPGTPPDIWALHPWAPDATNAAYRDTPGVIIWHFQLARTERPEL